MFEYLLVFFGGLGIFLYGTHLLSKSLQKIGALKMRSYLAAITDTRIKGVMSGIVVTFLLQSSTVTNIIVVGLVSGTVISLSQAFGIVLGSAIGTTLTVQVLTFDVAKYATLFIFAGAIAIIFVRHNKWNSAGSIVLSIGFIFFGIGQITQSIQPLAQQKEVLELLEVLAKHPVAFLVSAIIMTALMHSSAAMIIIGIALVTSGVLSVHDVLPLVLGANVGSTLPVVFSSMASRIEGRKVALFYFGIKTIGTIVTMLMIFYAGRMINIIPGSPERLIANFHTLFNIMIAIAFFPLLPYLAELFKRIYPKTQASGFFDVYLDDHVLKVPEEALLASKEQIVHLGSHVRENMIKKLTDFIKGDIEPQAIIAIEQDIDASYIKIQQYLLKLGQLDLTPAQSNQEVKLLNILNDIEHIGDSVVRFIGQAEKITEKNVVLGEEDRLQLRKLIDYIINTYENSLEAFMKNDLSLARENLGYQSAINQFEKDAKFKHFNSLINEKEYNPDISGVYLDVINQLLQVYHHSMNVSRTVLGLI